MKRRLYKVKVFNNEIPINIKTGLGLCELYGLIRPRIYNLANSYNIDGYDIEDKIQDLEIIVWKLIPKHNDKKSCFITFINICLKNHIRNEIKRNNKKHEVSCFYEYPQNI